MVLFCGGLEAMRIMPAAASALLRSLAVAAVGTIFSTSFTTALRGNGGRGRSREEK